jgi:uncharacterized membrane protein YeaQ/YmgE (transglycosylase-associated protein family)
MTLSEEVSEKFRPGIFRAGKSQNAIVAITAKSMTFWWLILAAHPCALETLNWSEFPYKQYLEGEMNHRIYFVLPDTSTAEAVEKELLLAHVDDHHMHFLAQDESVLQSLPKANLLQKSDLVHGLEQGLVVGGATGMLAGVICYQMPAFDAWFGIGIILVLGLAGALFGSWASGMIGISAPNTRLRRFDKLLRKGRILLMVDIPKERIDEITNLILNHHENARQFGEEPSIPAFP